MSEKNVARMKWDIREPCASCPYRRDVPLGTWNSTEYLNLLRNDKNQFGSLFGCHKYRHRPSSEHRPCVGWLLNQKKRGVPLLTLRLVLMSNQEALKCFEEATDGGHELYSSIEEMAELNIDVEKRLGLRPMKGARGRLESSVCVDRSKKRGKPAGSNTKKRKS